MTGRLGRRLVAAAALTLALAACGSEGDGGSAAPTTAATTTTPTATTATDNLADLGCAALRAALSTSGTQDDLDEAISMLEAAHTPSIQAAATKAREALEADDPFDGTVGPEPVRSVTRLGLACQRAGYGP